MKKLSAYIPSLIISILLVLLTICSMGIIIIDINVNAKRTITLSEKKNIAAKASEQLERKFKELSGASGIPAETYTANLDEEYLQSVINAYINEGYSALKSGEKFSVDIPENAEMNNAIEDFFNKAADETGYEKNDDFYKKLDNTKENAYKVIGEECDIYKFSALDKHGVLKPASKVYKMRPLLTFAAVGGTVLLTLFLIFVNRKEKKTIFYWTGICATIAGTIGMIPSIYLLSTKYFNAFSIKQPQIFTAYTGAMFKLTEAFMAASIAVCVAGIAMIVLYAVLGCQKTDDEPAEKTSEKPEESK
ncbi:MAG: hypothetical protein IJY29_04180 [Ruminococcus sp.]|nr:hypothetical protein [Ruminococcus sp.]